MSCPLLRCKILPCVRQPDRILKILRVREVKLFSEFIFHWLSGSRGLKALLNMSFFLNSVFREYSSHVKILGELPETNTQILYGSEHLCSQNSTLNQSPWL